MSWFELFFHQFCKSDMSRYGYLEVFQRVPWYRLYLYIYLSRAKRSYAFRACVDRKGPDQCTDSQSDHDLRCQLPGTVDTIESINGERRPGRDPAHAQDAVNLHLLRMPEGTFSLDAAHFMNYTLNESEFCMHYNTQ